MLEDDFDIIFKREGRLFRGRSVAMKKSSLNQSNIAIVLMLGFCLYWVWSFAGSFSVRSWYSPDGLARLFVTLPNCVLIGVLFIISRRNSSFACHKWFAAFSGLITAAGIIATTLYFNFGFLRVLFLPGYVFTGLGSAMLIVLWKEASSSLSAETNRLSVSIAVIGAAFLYLLQATLPFGIAVVICTLMPIGASYLFWRVLAVRDECQDAAFKGAVRSSDSPPMQDGVEYGLAVLSCAFLIGFQGVLRAMGFERPEFGTWALITSCAVLATSVIVVADVVFSNRRNRRFTIPLSAAAMLLVSFAALTLQNGRTAEVCAICSFFLVTIFIYSLLPALHVRRMDSLQSFLLALFIVGGSESLGIALGAVATQVFHLPLLLVGLPFLIASAASIIFMLIYARNRGSYIGVDASRFNEADSPAETSFPDDWKVGFGVNVDRGQDQRQEISDAISEKCKALSSEWALSDRESEILLKIALGRPYKVIANDLFISYNTIKTHVTHIYRKAGVHTRDELLAAIFDQGQVK